MNCMKNKDIVQKVLKAKYENKLWYKLEQTNKIARFIKINYIEKNMSEIEMCRLLECGGSKFEWYLRKYNLKKPRYLVSKKCVEIRFKKYNGKYCSEDGLKKLSIALSSKEVREKRDETMLSRYNVKYTAQSPILYKKMQNTNIQRYGYDNIFHCLDWQHKNNKKSWGSLARAIRYDNYYNKGGYKNVTDWSEESFNIIKNKENFIKYISKLPEENRTILFISKDLNVLPCNIRNRYKIWNIEEIYPLRTFRSLPEIEITEFIKTIYDKSIIVNTRNVIAPYELDIYLPDINLAVEYNR